MLLERIEIDASGDRERMQLGPFSHRLNAIDGPVGRAEQVIPQFVRDLMLGQAPRQYADEGGRGWDAGRLIWANPGGLLYCRREADGTHHGRLTIDFEPRDPQFPAPREAYRRQLAHMPAAMIDWIVTAVEPRALPQALAALTAAGLDTPRDPLQDTHPAEWQRLQTRVAELDRRLNETRREATTGDQLQRRRRFLQEELERWEQSALQPSPDAQRDARQRTLRQQEADLANEATRLRQQEAELRRALARWQSQLQRLRADFETMTPQVVVAEVHRQRLQDLDGQLIRWRETLREVRSLRERLAQLPLPSPKAPASRTGAEETGTPLQQLEARLESAHRQIDWLANRYAVDPLDPLAGAPFSAAPSEPTSERTAEPSSPRAAEPEHDLVGQLQGVKSELVRLYDSLQPTAAIEEEPRQLSLDQLRRCEIELLGSMEHLIRHRQAMLRQIATEHRIPLDQMTAAFGDWYQCQDHPHLYDWLLSSGSPARMTHSPTRQTEIARLETQRRDALEELDHTVNRLENCLAERRAVQHELEPLSASPSQRADPTRGRELHAELREIENQLDRKGETDRLEAERNDCLTRLERLGRQHQSEAYLPHRASRWLSRLSGGALAQIDWDPDAIQREARLGSWNEASASRMQQQAIRVDGQSATRLSPLSLELATLAVRMAAADALARRGQAIPLLIVPPRGSAFESSGSSSSLATGMSQEAADRFSANPRFPSKAPFASWLDGVIQFADSGQQTLVLTGEAWLVDQLDRAGATRHSLGSPQPSRQRSYHAFRSYGGDQPGGEPSAPSVSDPLVQANRDLDTAWRETYGSPEQADPVATMQEVDFAPRSDRPSRRLYDDGPARLQVASQGRQETKQSPFFLTHDSPVEQAPSVDAIAAARLRTAGISRVGQLLSADAQDLSEVLGLTDISAAAVRRWQYEADLVCRVPQLRGFDARVLVGCGITDPRQLAAMHPGLLLEKVEAFLATDRGRRILRSGSSYELSRITSWIAAANRSVARSQRHGQRRDASSRRDAVLDPHDAIHDHGRPASRSRERARSGQSPRNQAAPPHAAAQTNASSASRNGHAGEADRAAPRSEPTQWRFYLERQSPIVDAPSIGPRTADKLEKIGYYAVHDLLQADADELAESLGHRRVDGDRIRAWQQQASLVCRVPMLRGHDAQLLVAAGIEEPERLAECEPEALLALIEPVAGSSEGKRILRGAGQPDLAEVSAWIEYAQHQRGLAAA